MTTYCTPVVAQNDYDEFVPLHSSTPVGIDYVERGYRVEVATGYVEAWEGEGELICANCQKCSCTHEESKEVYDRIKKGLSPSMLERLHERWNRGRIE